MCPPTFLSGLLWGLRGGRGERGFGPRWGKRLQSCARTRRLPAVRSRGKVAPGAVPARPPALRLFSKAAT